MADRDGQSDDQAPRGLKRPPADAVVERDNILGADGGESDASDEAQKASGSDPADGDKSQPKRSKRDRRIKRLTRRAAQAEQALEDERRRSAELEAELERVRSGAGAKKPSLKEFDSEEEYAEAYSEWKAAHTPKQPKPRKKVEGPPQEELAAFTEAGAEKMGSAWEKAMDQARANKFSLNASMLEYLLDSDNGHAMFVALSKRPRLAAEIAGERGYAALELLQDLEDELSSPEPKEDPPRDKQGKFKKSPPPPGPKRLQGDLSTAETVSYDDIPHLDNEGGASAANLRKFMQRRRKEHNESSGF